MHWLFNATPIETSKQLAFFTAQPMSCYKTTMSAKCMGSCGKDNKLHHDAPGYC